jgi:hypothetical protein
VEGVKFAVALASAVILIERFSPNYDEVSLEGGLFEIDLETGNEQPPDTSIATAIHVGKIPLV